MTAYYIYDSAEEYPVEMFSLSKAKQYMREHAATITGTEKVKIYSNGESVTCGAIKLNGSNRCRVVGARNSNQY